MENFQKSCFAWFVGVNLPWYDQLKKCKRLKVAYIIWLNFCSFLMTYHLVKTCWTYLSAFNWRMLNEVIEQQLWILSIMSKLQILPHFALEQFFPNISLVTQSLMYLTETPNTKPRKIYLKNIDLTETCTYLICGTCSTCKHASSICYWGLFSLARIRFSMVIKVLSLSLSLWGVRVGGCSSPFLSTTLRFEVPEITLLHFRRMCGKTSHCISRFLKPIVSKSAD